MKSTLLTRLTTKPTSRRMPRSLSILVTVAWGPSPVGCTDKNPRTGLPAMTAERGVPISCRSFRDVTAKPHPSRHRHDQGSHRGTRRGPGRGHVVHDVTIDGQGTPWVLGLNDPRGTGGPAIAVPDTVHDLVAVCFSVEPSGA